MRESRDTKARRLLVERRVDVRWANHDPERGPVGISAVVRGDSGTYHAALRGTILARECDCACPKACSHAEALTYLFTTIERRTR